MPNDVPMFERGDLSIAVGNASSEMQQRAQYVATSNKAEGFTNAVERLILGDTNSDNATDEPF